MWRAHVLALINMNIIKSPFLHQCRLQSNGNGCKIVQKSFIQSSSNLQEANHLGFSSQQSPPYLIEANLYLLLSFIAKCFHLLDTIKLMKWQFSLKLVNLKNIYSSNAHKLTRTHIYTYAPPINNIGSISYLILIPILMLLCF